MLHDRIIRCGFRLLTKKEKAWFFLLCGQQAKTNELIFLVIYSVRSGRNSFALGLSSICNRIIRCGFFIPLRFLTTLLRKSSTLSLDPEDISQER